MKTKYYILTLATVLFATTSLSANKYDTNKDKKLSWEEFEAMKKEQASENGREYKEKETKYLFEDKDRDGDGFLSNKEIASHPVDINDDNSISYDEFHKMWMKRAERNGNKPTDTWIKDFFGKKDTDGDGVLSYQELAKPLK